MKIEEKVVFDTNIWISYFLGKRFEELAKLILNNDLNVQTCDELINEIEDVISRKKLRKQIDLPIERYINFHKSLTNLTKIDLKFNQSPDIKDNFLFDLALQTNSKLIVTGDKKLLNFEYEEIEVISLTNFKKIKL